MELQERHLKKKENGISKQMKKELFITSVRFILSSSPLRHISALFAPTRFLFNGKRQTGGCQYGGGKYLLVRAEVYTGTVIVFLFLLLLLEGLADR